MSANPENKKIIIGITGQTGAGKSTLGEALAQYFNAPLWKEIPPAENEYLVDFYQALSQKQEDDDPYIEVAHKVQHKFLRAAIEQGKEIAQSDAELIIWEMPPQGHVMYAFLQHQDGIMSDEEYQEYLAVYFEEIKHMPHVSGFFVVTIDDIITQLTRMGIREDEEDGRDGETKAPDQYWDRQKQYKGEAVNTHRIALVYENRTDEPMVEVETNLFDPRRQEHLLLLIETMCEYVPELSGFVVSQVAA